MDNMMMKWGNDNEIVPSEKSVFARPQSALLLGLGPCHELNNRIVAITYMYFPLHVEILPQILDHFMYLHCVNEDVE